MSGFGRLREVSEPYRISINAFARPQPARARSRHWLGALPLAAPLLAAACLTFNQAARAEPALDAAPQATASSTERSRWSPAAATRLVELIEESKQEGLNPHDYQADALRAAIAAGAKGPEFDSLVNISALGLAHDYASGRIDDKASLDWHIAPPIDLNMLAAGLDRALAAGELADWLQGLLPQNAEYRALKAAYASADPADTATRDRLRANLERWRWMPRALGDRYLYVNVPSYRLALVDNGSEQASYNVVVGTAKTPTPQLAFAAQSIIANPDWILPPSVLKEGKWRNGGYAISRRADGSPLVRQPPGPKNALGRIKIDMPNPFAIYLHDTPQKGAFERQDRALSHGCIRVQNIEDLAALLYDRDSLDEALANPSRTRVFKLERSVPVYIVYFTALPQPDGSTRFFDDPYDRDRAVVARLDGATEQIVRVAAR